jgi:hypothetical protein
MALFLLGSVFYVCRRRKRTGSSVANATGDTGAVVNGAAVVFATMQEVSKSSFRAAKQDEKLAQNRRTDPCAGGLRRGQHAPRRGAEWCPMGVRAPNVAPDVESAEWETYASMNPEVWGSIPRRRLGKFSSSTRNGGSGGPSPGASRLTAKG